MTDNENTTIQARFVKAWNWAKNPDLDCCNPHFKNRYASLAATLGAVRKACSLSNLVYGQVLTKDEDGYYLKSYVMDESGERIELSVFPVTNVPNPQAFGSELTYKKRQQAQADWGIVGEEDDDGEAAVEPLRGAQKPDTVRPVTDKLGEVRKLYKAATEAGIKADGIDAWAIANLGTGLAGLSNLDDAGIKAFKDYLEARTAEIKALKAEAA